MRFAKRATHAIEHPDDLVDDFFSGLGAIAQHLSATVVAGA